MSKKPYKGSFIVFEGIDGSGTTTQARSAAEWLRGRGEKVHLTREPSDGPVGTLLRQILKGRLVSKTPGGDAVAVDPATIALMFAADRLDHVQNEVLPYLQQGYVVVSDRYVLSSLAYQSVEVDLKFVRAINDKALAPDLTLFLKVPPEVAMRRIAASRSDRDTFETLPFQRQVAECYERLIGDYRGGKVVTIDGELALSTVTGRIRAEMDQLIL